MKTFTVAECEQEVQIELAAAKHADPADRKRHLDRAAVFAHLSEQARWDAEQTNGSGAGDAPNPTADSGLVVQAAISPPPAGGLPTNQKL